MITLTEEQVESLCDKYCRFPYNVEQEDLEQICEKCPLNGDDHEKSQPEVS